MTYACHKLAAMLCLSLALPARPARADETRAPAQALFDEAVQAMNDKDFEHACPKLEAVVQLQPGKVGAMMQLALCYEQWGKVASAWGRYRAVADAAGPNDERGAQATAKANELAPRVPKLTVLVAPSNKSFKGFTVSLGGRELSVVEFDSAQPADASVYDVVASAPGMKTWKGSVTVKADGPPAEIKVPALVMDPNSKGARVEEPPGPDPHRPIRNAGFVIGGVGVVSLAIAGITGGLFLGKKSTAEHECISGNRCTKAGLDAISSGRTLGAVNTVTLFTGIAALGVGAGLVITATIKKAPPATLALVPTSGGGALSFQEAF